MADQVTIDRAVVQQALEALKYMHDEKCDYMRRNNLGDPLREDAARLALPAINALTTALAQAEQVQEPVAWMRPDNRVAEESYSRTQFSRGRDKPPIGTWTPLYTAPSQRKPLTEKEMYIVEEEARKNFRLSQAGPRGQMITYWDSLTPWLIRAVERAHGIKEAK